MLALYLLLSLLPIYWMINMSLKTNEEIVSTLSMWPHDLTLDNYMTIFTDPSWYSGYINSIIYVGINTVLSVAHRAAGRLCVLALHASSATSTCSSGC